jgi:tetratricopeptide (TPR) repeat protein
MFLGLGAFRVLSAQPAPTAPQPAVALAHRAERLKKAFSSGNDAAIQGAVLEVELLRRTYGTLDVTPLVDAMAIWARQQGEEGNPALGLQVVQTVERWAPKQPVLLGTRVILMRQQGLKGYFFSMPDVLELTKARLVNPQHRWLWIVQHVAWLRMMAAALLWGWGLTLALRYRNVFRDLWESRLFRRMGGVPSAVLGALLVASPLLVGLDPSVVVTLWVLLLAPFLYRAEVKITVLVLLLQFVHPVLAFMEPSIVVSPSRTLASIQLQPATQPMEALGILKLSRGDQDFLAGWRQLQAQDWPGAEATFTGLLNRHPDKFAVLNNRGVARYQQGRIDEAKADFDQAANVAGRPAPEILLNQSVIAFRQLDSVTGSSKEEEARQIAPEDVARLMSANQARSDLRTFPSPLPDTPERLSAMRTGAGQEPESLESRLRSRDILFGLLLPLIGLGLFLLRVARSVKQAHPTQCNRCGQPFHTTDSPDVEICSKCHHLFLLKDGLHGESRKKKVQEVASFQGAQGWIHRLLVIVAPGLDLCFLGASAEGFLEFCFLTFALGIALATGRSVRFPGELVCDPSSIWQPLGLALLMILFVRSWFKLIPRRH